MKPVQKPTLEQRVVLSLLLLWLLVTTTEVAPINPPAWATGIFYGVWYIAILWGLLIVSMTPSGIMLVVSKKFFGRYGMIVSGFIFLWIFDTFIRKHYPNLPLSPGCALSMLYVFLMMEKLSKANP